ncbi:MAG: signal recognition particle-docking protein FtsY [Candidatus Aenigmatarchaeota archaeon]
MKKKLKEGIDKITRTVSDREEKKIEEAVEEVKKEDHIEEPKKELMQEVKAEIEKPTVEETPRLEEPKEETKQDSSVEKKPIEGIKITYFVHGTTTDNEKGIASGWSNPELSDLGRKQSADLKGMIDFNIFDAVFSSDLKRAVDSAKLTFADLDITEDVRLRECNYGDMNNTAFDVDSKILEHINHSFPNGESYRNVERRVAGFLNFLFDNFYGKHIAIVAHRAPQLAIEVLLNGKSWKEAVKEDWRLTKQWKSGWEYEMKQKIDIPKIEEKVEVKKFDHIPAVEKKIVEDIQKEAEAEINAETRIEEAKETIETAKEIEQVEKERFYEEADAYEKRAEEKLIEPQKTFEEIPIEEPVVEEAPLETIEVEKQEASPIEEAVAEPFKEIEIEAKPAEEKRSLLGRLFKRKPKAEKPKEQTPEEKGIIEKIKKKITEKELQDSDVKDILKDMETSLLSSDVALEVSEKIVSDLRNNLVGKFIKRSEIESAVKNSFKDSLLEILGVEGFDLVEKVKTKKPFVIIFLGFNGSGKTTTIARVAYLLKSNGVKCVLAAADCFRAASIEQLEEHGRNLGIEVIKHDYGSDPAAVIFDAVKHAQAKDIDVVLADTAGRSQSNVNLMEELKKIIRVNKPDLKILVVDALTGNDVYDQCKMFNDAVGVDGLIITKADVYEKGGATLSASYTIKKPILYLGVGQNYEDLEKFDSQKIVQRLLE